jgi:hypothetical protein
VAAGRREVFSRVAEARAKAALAGRTRAARLRSDPAPSSGGSTPSAGSPVSCR